MKKQYGDQFEIVPIIADVQDRGLIFDLMSRYQPDVCIMAAHKHVPFFDGV